MSLNEVTSVEDEHAVDLGGEAILPSDVDTFSL